MESREEGRRGREFPTLPLVRLASMDGACWTAGSESGRRLLNRLPRIETDLADRNGYSELQLTDTDGAETARMNTDTTKTFDLSVVIRQIRSHPCSQLLLLYPCQSVPAVP